MEVGEKPFPCQVAGCKASFATEDHLTGHQGKHESAPLLNLELPNKSNLFADQTPTPTRLIGKCEEVGLFEDLQNVNPFDETFRRAVEEKITVSDVDEDKSGKFVPVGTGDDTLHTPHVFPLLERRESIKERTYKLSKLFISRSISRKDEVTVTVQPPSTGELKRKSQESEVHVAPKKAPVAILPKVTPVATSVDVEIDPVKVKLKKYLARNGPLEAAPSKSSKKPSISTKATKLPENISNNSRVEDDKETTEKQERWKAAAKRYRTRLKQNQDMIAHRNVTLEEENTRLKAEVVRLRSMLALHKDCSVTRALSGAAVAAGPSKVVPVQQQQPTVVVGKNPVYIVIAGTPAVQNQLCLPEKRS